MYLDMTLAGEGRGWSKLSNVTKKLSKSPSQLDVAMS